MIRKDNQGSIGNEQESNLKNPDRRRLLGATAVAAAVGTVGQAGSSAFAQVNPSASPQTYPALPSAGGGTVRNIKQLKMVMQLVRAGIAATDVDGGKNTLDLGQYMKSWRIVPIVNPGNSSCACGCS
jgi:hypothetical protein